MNKYNYRKVRNLTKTIVRQAHKQSWERFLSVIKHNVFGKVMAYKVLKVIGMKEKITFERSFSQQYNQPIL